MVESGMHVVEDLARNRQGWVSGFQHRLEYPNAGEDHGRVSSLRYTRKHVMDLWSWLVSIVLCLVSTRPFFYVKHSVDARGPLWLRNPPWARTPRLLNEQAREEVSAVDEGCVLVFLLEQPGTWQFLFSTRDNGSGGSLGRNVAVGVGGVDDGNDAFLFSRYDRERIGRRLHNEYDTS
ncbi:hypothetical protein B0T10DRAFT_1451 [Thelonectria olida]|uniref:Uncharacterized protein n=1 Tax=Thelonectria olida TaxID=1576542 RepID=A0A9P8WJI9_9HYPO|nr:hypothetical protein B0T10DRAFT_1451 [Thelonectria olida]